MLRVRLFGGVEAELDGRPLEPPRSRRAWSLLAFLALSPGAHPRGVIASRFWPDVLDSSARGNLRTVLWALRSALGPDGERYLVGDGNRIALDGDGLWVDVRAFEALREAGRLEEAVALCDADLVAGLDEEWATLARDEHRDRLDALLAELAERSRAQGADRAALGWARRRAGLNPFAEAPQRDLMVQLAGAGDAPAALAVYAKLSERLRRELRVAPSAATRELAERVRSQASDAAPAGGAARASRSPPRAKLPPLVGRSTELELLLGVLADAAEARGALALISGPAGVGKTRLVAELLGEAVQRGFRKAGAAALELGGPAPLSLWAELLRDLLAGDDLPAVDEAPWLVDLTRLVPDLARRLDVAPSLPSGPPDLERARLYEAMVDLLAWASRSGPVVLALEDLHTADAASLGLIDYVGRRLADQPVLLLLTRREPPRRSEVDAALVGLRARGALACEVELGLLDPEAVADLARAAGRLDDDQVATVVQAAEGNPLLAVESARALAAGERLAPSTLRGVVRAASRGLEPDTWRLAEIAAVAGRDLEPAEIDRLPLADMVHATAGALDSGLLVDRGGRVGYRHALLRQAVYDDLPRPRRTWAHEQFAEILGPERAAESARHLRLAGRAELAVAHLARAASAARQIGALEEAETFLVEATDIVPRDAPLLLELAEVQAWRSASDRAEETLQRALDAIPGDDATARADAHVAAGNWMRGAVCDPHAALARYRDALHALDRGAIPDADRRAMAAAGSAWCVAVAGDPSEVEAWIERAEQLGRPDQDPILAHDLASARGLVLVRRGRFVESVAPLLEAGEHAHAGRRPDLAYTSWAHAATAAAAGGELERALVIIDRALGVMRQHGLTRLELDLIAARSHVLVRLERPEQAVAAVHAERELARRLDDPELTALAEHDAGLVALAAGQVAAAESALARALAGTPRISRPLARLARAEALVALGRPDAAEEELRATVREPLQAADGAAMLAARFARVQGLVAAARGDRTEASKRFREAIAGWERRTGPADVGESWMANIVDLGRPPVVGLIEPARELERLRAELERLAPTSTAMR